MPLKQELETQGNWLFRYRSFLPIIVLALGLGVFIQNVLLKNDNDCSLFFEMLCLAVSILGLIIRVYTVGFTPHNTSGRNTKAGQVADELNTTGIYSTTRNPLYLGNFFMWLGLAMFTENLWFVISFVFFYWVYYERIVFAEEQFLERKFGEQYTKWADKVPGFIPNLYLFRNTHLSFSLKKVLLKEKNGLFAMFLIFTVFEITGEIILRHTHYNMIFIVGCILTMILYIILKVIKKRKTMLQNKFSQ